MFALTEEHAYEHFLLIHAIFTYIFVCLNISYTMHIVGCSVGGLDELTLCLNLRFIKWDLGTFFVHMDILSTTFQKLLYV